MEWKDQSIYPAAAPPAERLPWRQRLKPTLAVWTVITVFVLVVTGMYAGWLSATEGAAVGAAATGLLAVTLGGMRWQGLKESPLSIAETTGLIFPMLLGDELFSAALALSRVRAELSAAIAMLDVSLIVILFDILMIYFVFDCFTESMTMVRLT